MRKSVWCWFGLWLVACSGGGDKSSAKDPDSRTSESKTRDEPTAYEEGGRGAESTPTDTQTGTPSSDDEANSDAPNSESPAPDAGAAPPKSQGSGSRPRPRADDSTPKAGSAAPPDVAADDSDAGVTPDEAPTEPVEPTPPTEPPPDTTSELPDVHFAMDVKVPAGAELLKCKYVAIPTDRGVIAVPSAESHYTPGSHHFLVYRSNLVGVPEDQTDVFDCADNDWDHNRGSYYEAQQPNSSRSLPAGVAQLFQPNEVIILQSHYINAGDSDLDAHAEFILHTMDPAKVEQEAGSILFNNANIFLPPHSRTRVSMTCPLPQDFNPAELWSHMHSRSSNFIATTDDPDAMAALGGVLYMEPNWAEPQPRQYPSMPPITLHAGSHITFSCDMTNETDNTITFGNSAETNEMCILHGMYWPRMTDPDGAEGCRGGSTKRESLDPPAPASN